MLYETPFVTGRYTAYAGDRIVTNLSLAVSLTDEFTGEPPPGRFRVYLKERRHHEERGAEPIRNLSGYLCFLDLDPGTFTLVVEPPAGARFYYLKPAAGGSWSSLLERSVDLPRPDPKEPVVELVLAPSAAYPFPVHATLVRGQVQDGAASAPAAGAIVSAPYSRVDPDDFDLTVRPTAVTQTDARGFYALFFKAPRAPVPAPPPPDFDPAQQDIQVTAQIGARTRSRSVTIREGRTTGGVNITVP